MRLLIVEDEADLAHLVARKLRKEGFLCDQASNLGQAFDALAQFPYEIMLLDRRLPDGDGVEALSIIRSVRPGIRILVLTARNAPRDRIEGLNAGADDYVTKPFDSGELLARIRARLRGPGSPSAPPIVLGALKFDLDARNVWVAGKNLALPKREFALLEALTRAARRVVTRAALLGEVYGSAEEVHPGALDTLVWRLRKRLDQEDAGIAIHLVHGRGYMLGELED